MKKFTEKVIEGLLMLCAIGIAITGLIMLTYVNMVILGEIIWITLYFLLLKLIKEEKK